MYRSRASASSTAATEPSLPTNRGKVMYGKMTMSRTGSRGRTSGISGPLSFSSSGEGLSPFAASAPGSISSGVGRFPVSVGSAGASFPSPVFFFVSSVMSSFPLPSFPSSGRHRDPALPPPPFRDLRDRDYEDPVRHPRRYFPKVHRAPHFEGPLEFPEDPFQAQEGGLPRGKIRELLPGDLDPVPQHPDLHGCGRDPRDLQQDPDRVVHLHDVRGRLAGGFHREVEQHYMGGPGGRPTLLPNIPRRLLARAGTRDLSAHVISPSSEMPAAPGRFPGLSAQKRRSPSGIRVSSPRRTGPPRTRTR